MNCETKRHADAREQGFTLAELLIVIALLALFAGLALANYTGPQQQVSLRMATSTLVNQLQMAKAQAGKRNTESTLVFDAATRSHWVEGVTRVHTLPQSVSADFETVHDERITGTRGRVRFYPDGTASGGRFILRAGKSQSTVTVDWMTGAVDTRHANAD